jgi:hypothetical protein
MHYMYSETILAMMRGDRFGGFEGIGSVFVPSTPRTSYLDNLNLRTPDSTHGRTLDNSPGFSHGASLSSRFPVSAWLYLITVPAIIPVQPGHEIGHNSQPQKRGKKDG